MFPLSRPVLAGVVYTVAHLAAHASARHFEVSPGLSIWYAPAGLAFGLLLLIGPRAAPVVFGANLAAALLLSSLSSWWAPVAFPALITATYTAAAWWVRRWTGPGRMPDTPAQLAVCTVAMVVSPLLLAVAGTVLLRLIGLHGGESFSRAVLLWWVGDVSGILTVVPLVLAFGGPWLHGPDYSPLLRSSGRASPVVIALQSLALIGSMAVVFTWEPLRDYNAFYLSFLPLIWICLRHGLRGATLASVVVTMSGLLAIHLLGSTPYLIVNFVLFAWAVAGVGLGLGFTASRRLQAERSLLASVTDRKRAEAETELLLQVVEATTDYVATISGSNARIRYGNTALANLVGRDTAALRGQALADLMPAWASSLLSNQAMPAALREGVWHGDLALLDKNGKEVPVSLVALVHQRVALEAGTLTLTMRSLVRRNEAEADRIEQERRMLQTQRLESLGVLAGGVAHDFNNLLTPMLGYASLARQDLPEDSPVQHALIQVETAAHRAASLCQQMLAYAGRSPLAFAALDLSSVIQEIGDLLKLSIGKNHALALELAMPLPTIVADANQIRQAVMNLVLNASEAIGEKTNGSVAIRTQALTIEPGLPSAGFVGGVPAPGPAVVLEVEDDGGGISPEQLPRIFDPFFSTKFTGHGLGLPVVMGIARTHSAALQVKTEPGRGTLFRMYFPAVPIDAEMGTPLGSARVEVAKDRAILVVDDEPGVREMVSRTLEILGYTTLVAEDGVQAVERFKEHEGRLGLVLLDLTMPRMDGEQAFHEMHRLNPEVPVVLMSGYSEKLSRDRFAGACPAGFLAKPFNYAALKALLE